ncbi:OX-2 membrane glycoprotein-like isoform X2 [Sebastes umbrosus]|uniref:OX-2 membrane glycoprotein-like isoform X2 n=1 Tax=Sebastes umbrosus TaxID=72105 RepID=UPI00189C5A53|nr:OX-2 membrane glycoprotein-like isoform X2 [Sebastes umbrosus]
MAHRAVLHFLCVLGVFQKGLTALIETQHTVVAAVGDEACLYCHLIQSGDVEQVTWLKILPEGEKNLAASHKDFGQKVNPDFTDKMEFKYAGLQNTSIVIRRVMEEDEGCYRCLFNTFSEGALNATICLKLYELHGPFLHVTESTVVSCSATARPAPTVTLTVPHYNSTSVTNTNGTVTVTATAGLSGLHGNSTQVGCAVRVLSGPQIEVSMMIPEVKQSSDDGFDEESGSNNNFTLIIVSVVVACVCVVAAVVIALLIRKHRNRWSHRDPEENKTPQKAIKDTDESAKVQSPKPTPKRKTLLLNCLKRLVEVCLPAGGAPCMDQPFKLQVDASDVGAGAVLFQTDGSGVDRPAPELLSGGWLAAGE